MDLSVIVSMILVLGFYWGGTIYLLLLTLHKEKEKKS
jgi:hypothetical protein